MQSVCDFDVKVETRALTKSESHMNLKCLLKMRPQETYHNLG